MKIFPYKYTIHPIVHLLFTPYKIVIFFKFWKQSNKVEITKLKLLIKSVCGQCYSYNNEGQRIDVALFVLTTSYGKTDWKATPSIMKEKSDSTKSRFFVKNHRIVI